VQNLVSTSFEVYHSEPLTSPSAGHVLSNDILMAMSSFVNVKGQDGVARIPVLDDRVRMQALVTTRLTNSRHLDLNAQSQRNQRSPSLSSKIVSYIYTPRLPSAPESATLMVRGTAINCVDIKVGQSQSFKKYALHIVLEIACISEVSKKGLSVWASVQYSVGSAYLNILPIEEQVIHLEYAIAIS
jgi:hypothetical protein